MSRTRLSNGLSTTAWNSARDPTCGSKLRQTVFWSQQRCITIRRVVPEEGVFKQSRASSRKNLVRPTASWLLPPGNTSDPDQILRQLPRCSAGTNPAALDSVIFLATPKFAHLFEPGSNWLTAAMNTIWPRESGDQNTDRKSYVAIVDALPSTVNLFRRHRSQFRGHEGVAVCLSSEPEVESQTGTMDDKVPVISFQSQRLTRRLHYALFQTTFKAPVANTLFVNGEQSTMFSEAWKRVDDRLTETRERRKLSNLTLPLYDEDRCDEIDTRFHISLMRLTRPAQVVSSMGNIVREIQLEDGTTVSASHELERVVPPLVKQLQGLNPNGELRVFAVVCRNVKGKTNPFREHLFHGLRDKESPDSEDLSRSLRYQTLAKRLIAMDARIHRVTSGGAGWGKKAGLLSLDPKTKLNEEEDQLSASMPSFLMEKGGIQMERSKNLFPAGMTIQFVASWHDTTGQVTDGVSADSFRSPIWTTRNYFSQYSRQYWCIGTTILPETVESSRDLTAGPKASNELIFCPGRFGLLTTGPLWLSSRTVPKPGDMDHHEGVSDGRSKPAQGSPNGERTAKGSGYLHETLVEVPNSSFLSCFPACGELPAVAQEDSTTSSAKSKRDVHVEAVNMYTRSQDNDVSFGERTRALHNEAKARKSMFSTSAGRMNFRKVSPAMAIIRTVPAKPQTIRKIDADDPRMQPRPTDGPPALRPRSFDRGAEDAERRRKKQEAALRGGYSDVRRRVVSPSSIFSRTKERDEDVDDLLRGL